MYDETNYLNYQDLNNIENKIEELTTLLQNYSEIPTYQKNIWGINDFPYIQLIQKIETAINNLGEYWYKPIGWLEQKIWLTGEETEQVIKSFSFEDINRWINNLNLAEQVIGDNSIIWNGYSDIEWNSNINNIDWEE